jgi:hypothetical protein
MAAVKYSNIYVALSPQFIAPRDEYPFIATNVNIQYSNQLQPGRILSSIPNQQMRIGGNLETKISIDFIFAGSGPETFATSFIFENATGNFPIGISINNAFFSGYLNSASLNIQPFAPITCNADFSIFGAPTGTGFGTENFSFFDNYYQQLAHGHNVLINGGTNLSDSSRDSISYKVVCNRTPVYEIGSINATNVFLDSVEKEVSIRSTNIGKFINYSGYGDVITIDPKNDLGFSVIEGVISMSANSRVVSQNLSAQEGDILAGEVTLREVVL